MEPIKMADCRLGDEEIDAVARVMRSGVLTNGDETEEFEREFAASVETLEGVAVNSGTSALYLAYKCLIKPGDEVIVPTMTYASTVGMVLECGGTPVFCDIDPFTWNMDHSCLPELITRKTSLIVPVHLYGNPVDSLDMRLTVNEINPEITIVFDAAQAHGAKCRDFPVGAFGRASLYSFYATKNMTTGEGGMVVTDDRRLASKMCSLRDCGETSKYVHQYVGHNFRMTEMQAAIGRVQLRKLPGFVARRREIAAIYRKYFDPHIRTQKESGTHSYHQFVIKVENRDHVKKELANLGIETAVHYPKPVNLQPAFRDQLAPHWEACELAEQGLSLPIHPRLTDEQVEYVADSVVKIVNKEFAHVA